MPEPTDVFSRYVNVRATVDAHIVALRELTAPLVDALDAAQQRLDELVAERDAMPAFLEKALVKALDTGDKHEVDVFAARQRELVFACDHAKIGVLRAKLALEATRNEYLAPRARETRLELNDTLDQAKVIDRARNFATGASGTLSYGAASSAEAVQHTRRELDLLMNRVTKAAR